MNVLRVFAFMALLVSAASAWADVKIAVVDLRAAILQSDEAKMVEQKLNTSLSQDEADAVALRKEIGKLQEKLQKDQAVMSQDEVRDLQKKIDDKNMDFSFKNQKIQKSQKDAMQDLISNMAPKVDKELHEIAKEKKLDLILRTEVVPFADKKLDITSELIKRLNQSK